MEKLWKVRITAAIRRADGKESVISNEWHVVAKSVAEALQTMLIEFRAEVNAVGMTFLYVETFDYERLDDERRNGR